MSDALVWGAIAVIAISCAFIAYNLGRVHAAEARRSRLQTEKHAPPPLPPPDPPVRAPTAPTRADVERLRSEIETLEQEGDPS